MAGRSRKKAMGPTPIEAVEHTDTRANIPTEELRDFVASDEKQPSNVLYPRDPSLDPQLVWQGKDGQDSEDLAVPVPPVYIQEKIEPRAIIEDLRRKTEDRSDELTLFADFNGLEFEQLIDFYHHGVNWSNRLILGDSLQVMASLAEKEDLRGQVQMIYIDPPYGIKFGSNWQVSTRKRDVRDGKDTDLTRQPEQIRAFRDTWEKGIHSYLAYLRDRLVVAHDLLTDSGSVFVQISDENVHLVRALLDETFGSENAVVTIVMKKKGSQRSGYIDPVNDYLLWYSKAPRSASGGGPKFRNLFAPRPYSEENLQVFRLVELQDGSVHPLSTVPTVSGEIEDFRSKPERLSAEVVGARLFTSENLTSGGVRTNQSLPYSWNGKTFEPKAGNSWKHTARATKPGEPSGMERLALAGRLLASENTWRYRRFFADFPYTALDNWWDNLGGAANPIYVVQTNPEIVKRCILMTTDPGDLVLDPTCGSGTTSYVAEQWGRRWITIDTSRVALALARTRLMAARFPYYLLADSEAGRIREAEVSGIPPGDGPVTIDVKKGFVYRRALHITSTTIANNPDIREGMTQGEVDEAIRRHADQELLYDQPYEDPKRVRVTGRFTVESLSPHRVLDPDEDRPATELAAETDPNTGGFVPTVLANLRKAGVQNTKQGERLTFDTLEPFAGAWIQASGEFTDKDGVTKRLAVSIGPEHGTVGPTHIKEAAKEALRGVGFEILVVCGFAFDARVGETAREFGDLVVLPARMNPDLMMGEDLLKKTGAGNLFTVFGEPDVNIKEEEGELVVELLGVDVYDPTTGEVRSSSTDDIACWFIDTNYNQESFFVRHAYFTGGDEPYDRLQRTLRAEIDEEAWASLYSTVSRPFAKPESGRVAVKVINHYGDEVLKVYEVD